MDGQEGQDTPELRARFAELMERFGPALGRLAAAWEREPQGRADLLQDIHLALWTALPRFEGRAALRTWVYRVAHNVASTHVLQARRRAARSADEELALEELPDPAPVEPDLDRQRALARLHALVQSLRPLDRQLFTLYLEGVPQEDIADITGLSAGNVAVKVHRIKAILKRHFDAGASAARAREGTHE